MRRALVTGGAGFIGSQASDQVKSVMFTAVVCEHRRSLRRKAIERGCLRKATQRSQMEILCVSR
jgi:UDP-glucose 4-epimerase